jgi:hypothetical protein
MWCALLLSVGLAAGASSTTVAAPTGAEPVRAGGERMRVLVLDFRDDGGGPELVQAVRDTIVVHLSQKGSFEVLSTEDLRRVSDLEASREAMGCDESSCLSEMAGAVGAERVVFGSVGRLGDLTQVTLSVLDVDRGTMTGRQSFEVTRLDEIPARLRHAADEIFSPGAVQVPFPAAGWAGLGVAAVGATTATVGGILMGADAATLADTTTGTPDQRRLAKDAAEARYPIASGVLIGGVVIVAVGAAVAIFAASP